MNPFPQSPRALRTLAAVCLTAASLLDLLGVLASNHSGHYREWATVNLGINLFT